MGHIINIKKVWLLISSMLVSAIVTSGLIRSHVDTTDLLWTTDYAQEHLLSVMTPARLEDCCLNQITYFAPPRISLPTLDKTVKDSEHTPVTNIWGRIRNGFSLPEVHTNSVQPYIDQFTKHPHLFEHLLQRAEPYLVYILNRLQENNMPTELALLPVVESAFDPFAASPTGAAGIWQFMPATATDAGLEKDWWYDGRLDIVASTEAALGYLDNLHTRFNGDWLLTLAAYNAGSGRVWKAIRHNRDAGEPTDFWHLPLPSETRSYVPKLIALRKIIENPNDFSISLQQMSGNLYFSAVDVQGQIEFRVAARLAGIPLAELQRLNPGYKRSITQSNKVHTLLVPKPMEKAFRERIARLPTDQRIESIHYRIRQGDSLSAIAQQFSTTVSKLRRINRLKGSKIIAGDLLIVPVGERENSIAGNAYARLM